MALSKEQFDELRKKGLSVDQIVSFEAGNKPVQTKKASEVKLWDTSGFKSGFVGIGKGLGKIGLGIGTLGRGLQRAATPKALEATTMSGEGIFDVGSEKRQEAEEFLAPSNRGESIASTITEIGATAAPSGGVFKATKGLGFAAKMLGRGAGGAVTGTIQGGGEVGKETLIGAAAETVLPGAVKQVAKYGGNVLKGLTGLVSGKGSDVIEQIIKTPEAALAGGRRTGTQGLKEAATEVRSGVKTLAEKVGGEYEGLVEKAGVKQIPRKFVVDGVRDRLAGLADGVVDGKNVKFVDTPFSEAEEKQFTKIINNVNNWEDFSPKGINNLAKKISRFRRGGADSGNFDRVVDTLKRDVREFVGQVAPTIKEANVKYSDKMDLLDQLDNLLKTDGAVTSREGIQKTSEAIGRLFNANKDIAREGVEEIEKELGINILGKEAGRQLVDGVSRSQSAIGDFATGVTKALIPPKVLLNVTAATGIAKNALEAKINILEPAARASAIELLTDLFGGEDTADETNSGANE
jgi:hypothetical protein